MQWLAPGPRGLGRWSDLLRRAGLAAAGLTLLTAVAGCGSDSSGSARPTVISIDQSVVIKNFAFAPAKLTVKAGTQVTFGNADAEAHTVTADDHSFDSKNLEPIKSFSYTFKSAGTVTYHCSIHTYMTGSVTVTG